VWAGAAQRDWGQRVDVASDVCVHHIGVTERKRDEAEGACMVPFSDAGAALVLALSPAGRLPLKVPVVSCAVREL
jgi:hypothetical protein